MSAPYSSPFQGLLKTLDDKWFNWQKEMTQGFKDMVCEVDEEVEYMIDTAKDKLDIGLKKDMKILEDAAEKELKVIFDYYKTSAIAIFKAGVDEKNFKKDE